MPRCGRRSGRGAGGGERVLTADVGTGLLADGVAVDSAGDVFATDFSGNRVIELSAGGTQTTLPFTGLNHPIGVAVDQLGDVFVADSGNNRVLELPAGATTQTVLPFTGLSSPTGLAFERDSEFTSPGFLYVADAGNNRIVSEVVGFPGQTVLPLTGLSHPNAVGVDGSFDLFVADNSQVFELLGGGTTQITLPFSGLEQPAGVAVDRLGDVFMTDSRHDRVLELLAGGSTQTTLPVSGISEPIGVAVDGSGDVIVADTFNFRVVALAPAAPGSLAFSPATAPSGSSIGATSVTPCPLANGTLGSSADVSLTSSSGVSIATAAGSLDGSGDWNATLTIPSSAANGTYFVAAKCVTPSGLVTQSYAARTLTVGPGGSGSQGPPGPAGPAGPAGPDRRHGGPRCDWCDRPAGGDRSAGSGGRSRPEADQLDEHMHDQARLRRRLDHHVHLHLHLRGGRSGA